MFWEIIDVDKLHKRIADIDAQLREVKILEDEKAQLERVKDVIGLYWSVKRDSLKNKSSYTVQRAELALKWFNAFPFLALQKGKTLSKKTYEGYEAEKTLFGYSKYDNDKLLKTDFSLRMEQYLKPFRKSKKQISELQEA